MSEYLTPETIARLGNLQVVARMVVSGVLSGHHRSPHYGFNIEFAEHRAYMPGDEIRHIDWNYYGKTDEYFVKQFEETASLTAMLVLDRSRSMDFGAGPLSKLDYARHLTASLTYLLLHQQDRVGLATFTTGLEGVTPPSASPAQLHRVLAQLVPGGEKPETAIRTSLEALASQLKRRHLVVLVSDMLEDPDQILAGVRALRYRRHDVLLFPVLSAEELDFPYEGMVRFRDLEEAAAKVTVDTSSLRERYRQVMEEHLAALTLGARELGADLEIFRTDRALEEGLGRYLSRRARSQGRA